MTNSYENLQFCGLKCIFIQNIRHFGEKHLNFFGFFFLVYLLYSVKYFEQFVKCTFDLWFFITLNCGIIFRPCEKMLKSSIMLVLLKRCHFYSYNLSSLAPFHKSNEVNNLKGVHFFFRKNLKFESTVQWNYS